MYGTGQAFGIPHRKPMGLKLVAMMFTCTFQAGRAESDRLTAEAFTPTLTIVMGLVVAMVTLRWSLRCPIRARSKPEYEYTLTFGCTDEPDEYPESECEYTSSNLCLSCGQAEAEDFLGGSECLQCYSEH